jgi:hypothetical protein
MNSDLNNPLLPTLTADLLTRSGMHTDNLFRTMWKRLHFDTILSQSGLKKRTGTPVTEVVYLLLLWVWLKANSHRSRTHRYRQHHPHEWPDLRPPLLMVPVEPCLSYDLITGICCFIETSHQ